MKKKIFISYRRDDSEMSVSRLYTDLRKAFGKQKIFVDYKSLKPGANFIEQIEKAITSCMAVIVLIGPNWLSKSNVSDHQEEDTPSEDYVMLEIASAFQHSIPVVPVLLGDAKMPSERQLPAILKSFIKLHAFRIRAQWWEYDVKSLISLIEDVEENKWKGKARYTAAAAGLGGGAVSANALLSMLGAAGVASTPAVVLGSWIILLPAGGAIAGYLAYKGAKKLFNRV